MSHPHPKPCAAKTLNSAWSRPKSSSSWDENGQLLEPIEQLYVDCDENFMGVVTDKIAQRKGRMVNCVNNGTGRVRLDFSVPSRGLIGYRDEFLTDTKGTGIIDALRRGYEPHRGDFPSRFTGSIVSDRAGNAVAYALFNLEPRGQLFVVPGDPVYEGMIVGEHNRDNDIDVNPTKEKKLTNMRASGKDEAVVLTPVRPMTLEHALHFVREDELVGRSDPHSIRLRKAELNALKRFQSAGEKNHVREIKFKIGEGREPFWRKGSPSSPDLPFSPRTFRLHRSCSNVFAVTRESPRLVCSARAFSFS